MPNTQRLIEQVKDYNPDADISKVEEAIEYAKIMHEGQTRSSGEPYYTHPVEVAGILADMKMDVGSILTAILHDTLEDTDATFEELEKKFGKEVAELVDGVSKLNRIRRGQASRKLPQAPPRNVRGYPRSLGKAF